MESHVFLDCKEVGIVYLKPTVQQRFGSLFV